MQGGAPVLVVAAAGDSAARRLVERWPGGGARLLTPLHLTTGRWSWHLDSATISRRAVIEGIDAGRPAGVVSLLDAVRATDVVHVREEDRAYVAAEATAFLQAWQHSAACPKLNPPSLSSLCGELHPLVWRAHAVRCGMTARAYSSADLRDPEIPGDAPMEQVTLIGNRAIGCADPRVVLAARALARATRLHMLQLNVSVASNELIFQGAAVRPNLDDAEVAEGITHYFERAPA